MYSCVHEKVEKSDRKRKVENRTLCRRRKMRSNHSTIHRTRANCIFSLVIVCQYRKLIDIDMTSLKIFNMKKNKEIVNIIFDWKINKFYCKYYSITYSISWLVFVVPLKLGCSLNCLSRGSNSQGKYHQDDHPNGGVQRCFRCSHEQTKRDTLFYPVLLPLLLYCSHSAENKLPSFLYPSYDRDDPWN